MDLGARVVAVPCEAAAGLDSPRSEHVGRAPQFIVVEAGADAPIVRAVANASGGHGAAAELLVGAGVTDVVTSGIGAGMYRRLTEAGVNVFRDSISATAGEAVEALLAGELAPISADQVHPGGHGHH